MNRKAASGQVPEPTRLPGRQLRRPHHALDRRHHPAVPDLPPGRPHLGLEPVEPRASTRGDAYHERRRQPRSGWPSRSSTSSPTSPSAPPVPRRLEPLPEPRAATTPASTRCAGGTSPPASPSCVVGINISFPIMSSPASSATEELSHEHRSPMTDSLLDGKVPAGPIEEQLGQPQVQHEAGEPGQQAQVRDHRGRHRPGRRRRPPPRWPSSATR